MTTSSHEHHDNRCTASSPRAKCYGSGHCLEQTIFHARLSRHSYMRGQHARLSFVADDRLQHARHSYVSSIARSIQLSQRRGVSAFPPLVPTRSLDHLLRFSKACPRAGILLRRSASFGIERTPSWRCSPYLTTCSFRGCKLGLCTCPLIGSTVRSPSS